MSRSTIRVGTFKGVDIFFTNRTWALLTTVNYAIHALYTKVMLASSFHKFVQNWKGHWGQQTSLKIHQSEQRVCLW